MPLAAALRLSCLCLNQPQAANEALAKAQADKAALAEECAALKGRVTALEEQLAAVAATSSTTEQMRARCGVGWVSGSWRKRALVPAHDGCKVFRLQQLCALDRRRRHAAAYPAAQQAVQLKLHCASFICQCSALEDASRLRGEVAGVAAERNALQAENVRLRGELEAAK